MGTKVFFFSGGNYVRYDRGDDKVDEGYPLTIVNNWPGMQVSGFDTNLDTAVNLGGGKLFFFKGSQYVRYDIASDKADDGYPIAIADGWSGMQAAGFDKDLEAAVSLGDGKVYFFKGDHYVRYDIANDKVDDGYPLMIADNWPGMLPAGFEQDLDAAINWGDGKIFFFKGSTYVRYDIAADKVDDGYPLAIADMWPGMQTAGFDQNLCASFDLIDLNSEIWIPGAEIRRKTPLGPKYRPMPWRGVLHTTEGGTFSGADGTFDTNKDWPHLIIEPKTFKVVQYIPLNVGSRALGDANGTLASNSAHAVQIEIVGMAKDSPDLPPEHLAFIRDVMRQIEDLVPIPRRSDRTFLHFNEVNAHPENRMSVQDWAVFSGWCGHQHVPGQNHWDPGAIDISALLNS